MPHRLAHDLAPELAVAGPCEPVGGPAVARIRTEHDGASEPDLPAREQGGVRLGREPDLRTFLRLHARVALQHRRPREVDAGERLGAALHDGPEGFLADVLVHEPLRLLDEDLRHAVGRLGVVEAAAAPARDLAEQLAIGLGADGDGRHRDLRVGHALREPLEVGGLRVAVGHQDHVLRLDRHVDEHPVRHLECRIDVGLAARREARDQVFGLALAAHLRERHRHLRLRVEGDHAEAVLLFEQVERAERRGLREIELAALHAVGAVEHDHERQFAPLLLRLERHGQHALER